MDRTVEDKLRARAHAIWEAEGRPDGREQEHWARAVRELASEDERPDPGRGDREHGDPGHGDPGHGAIVAPTPPQAEDDRRADRTPSPEPVIDAPTPPQGRKRTGRSKSAPA